jgi:hypothetical protein
MPKYLLIKENGLMIGTWTRSKTKEFYESGDVCVATHNSPASDHDDEEQVNPTIIRVCKVLFDNLCCAQELQTAKK